MSELMERAVPSWRNPIDIQEAIDRTGGEGIERFWSNVTKSDGCWRWGLGIGHDGYGRIRIGTKTMQAHRVAYHLLVGPIPHGLVIDHICRNRGCVNPEHMRAVTNKKNILAKGALSPSAKHARKTHCRRGHCYNEENTHRYRGKRYCRACDRERKRKNSEEPKA